MVQSSEQPSEHRPRDVFLIWNSPRNTGANLVISLGRCKFTSIFEILMKCKFDGLQKPWVCVGVRKSVHTYIVFGVCGVWGVVNGCVYGCSGSAEVSYEGV